VSQVGSLTTILAKDLKPGQVFRTLASRRVGWRLRGDHRRRGKGYRLVRAKFTRGDVLVLRPDMPVEVK
jgi:hypothetical protein